MLIEEAERRGAVRLRTPAACVLEHNLLLQINAQASSARFDLLRSTDQTTYGEISAFVNACFTAVTPPAMEPSWLLMELSPQHPGVNAFILQRYIEAAHRVHQASMLNLLEQESHLALRDGVHLYGTATAQDLLMLAQQGGATPSVAPGEP